MTEFDIATRRSRIGAGTGIPDLDDYRWPREHKCSVPFEESFWSRRRRRRIERRRQRDIRARTPWHQRNSTTAIAAVLLIAAIVLLAFMGDGTHVLTGGPQ